MSIIVHGRRFSIQNSSFDTLNAQESLFDNITWARGSLGWNEGSGTNTGFPLTTTAINGDEVGKLTTKKGSWTMSYSGAGAIGSTGLPVMDGKIPILIDTNYIRFKNLAATWYDTGGITSIAPPFEMWLVSRYMPGQRYEERLAGGGNAGLLGDSEFVIRMINAQYGFVPNSTFPEVYKTHIERMVVRDQTQADYWIDGTFVGTLPFESPDLNNFTKTENVIGVVSNNAVWDFAAQYFHAGTIFDDTTAATIFSSLATKWNTLTLPNQILLSGIGSTLSSGIYTPTATVINTPSGVTVAAMSAWDYQWYQDDGSLQQQHLFSTSYQPHTSDLSSSYGTQVKVLIRPRDTLGNFWGYLEGTYQ